LIVVALSLAIIVIQRYYKTLTKANY
jgi:hypothetical protein